MFFFILKAIFELYNIRNWFIQFDVFSRALPALSNNLLDLRLMILYLPKFRAVRVDGDAHPLVYVRIHHLPAPVDVLAEGDVYFFEVLRHLLFVYAFLRVQLEHFLDHVDREAGVVFYCLHYFEFLVFWQFGQAHPLNLQLLRPHMEQSERANVYEVWIDVVADHLGEAEDAL